MWLFCWRIYASLSLNELTHFPLADTSTLLKMLYSGVILVNIPSEFSWNCVGIDASNLKSTLVQVKAWCCHLSQCWPKSMLQHSNYDAWYHQVDTFFCLTGPLWGEFTCQWWITIRKGQQCRVWCFLCCSVELLLNKNGVVFFYQLWCDIQEMYL